MLTVAHTVGIVDRTGRVQSSAKQLDVETVDVPLMSFAFTLFPTPDVLLVGARELSRPGLRRLDRWARGHPLSVVIACAEELDIDRAELRAAGVRWVIRGQLTASKLTNALRRADATLQQLRSATEHTHDVAEALPPQREVEEYDTANEESPAAYAPVGDQAAEYATTGYSETLSRAIQKLTHAGPATDYPDTDYPSTSYPSTDYPAATVYPSTDYPAATVYPNTDYPAAAHTPTNLPAAAYTPTDYPTGAYTPTDFPTAAYTPTDFPAAPYTPTDYPANEYPATYSATVYSATDFPTIDYPANDQPTSSYPGPAAPNYPPPSFPAPDYPSSNNLPATDYSMTDYPTSSQPSSNYPAPDYPSTNFPSTNYPSPDYPSTNFPPANYPASDYPSANFPSTNYPSPDYPAGDFPGADYGSPSGDDPTTHARLVTVASATGGCGKTFFATNSAALLARAGNRVLLVDMDLQFGEVADALRIKHPYSVYDGLYAANGERLPASGFSKHLDRLVHHHKLGFDVLTAPRDPVLADYVGARDAATVLEAVASRYDVVITDTPPSLNDVVIAALDRSASVIVMATLDVPSLRNLTAFLDVLRRLGLEDDRIELVLNKADTDVGVTVDQANKAFHGRFNSVLPVDRAVSRSVNLGTTVATHEPRAKVSRALIPAIARLAERLELGQRPREAVILPEPTGRGRSLFGRLFARHDIGDDE